MADGLAVAERSGDNWPLSPWLCVRGDPPELTRPAAIPVVVNGFFDSPVHLVEVGTGVFWAATPPNSGGPEGPRAVWRGDGSPPRVVRFNFCHDDVNVACDGW